MYVCMSVCMCMYECTYVCACMYVHISMCMYLCACMYVHVCMYVCMCMYVRMYVCACMYVHLCRFLVYVPLNNIFVSVFSVFIHNLLHADSFFGQFRHIHTCFDCMCMYMYICMYMCMYSILFTSLGFFVHLYTDRKGRSMETKRWRQKEQ